MKSKYIKIFMIFAIAFTLLSALFVSPNVAFAASEDETIEYDLDSIEAQTPTSALLSFPVTWRSVYGNEINWSSSNEDIIEYDEEAHWMVVYREKVTGESATVILTVTVKNGDKSDSREIEVIVPAGKTATRTFTITYVNEIPEAEEGIELDKEYNLGDPTYVLPKLSYAGKAFMGWFIGETKVDKILVGSMQDYTLTAVWEDRAISSISAVANNEFTALETPAADDFTVTANYNDGTSETITSGYTVSSDKLHVGTTSVTVTYGQLSANANVTVNPIVLTTADIILSETEEITYDGAAHSFTKFNNNFEGLNISLEGEAQTNATDEAGATFTVNVAAQEGYENDYTLPFEPIEVVLVINKAELNVTVPSQSIEAGATASWNVEDFTISGLVSADESKKAELFDNMVVKYMLNGEYTDQLTAGNSYNVEFSLDLENYTVAFNNDAILTIETPTGITFKADQEPVTYNGQQHEFTAKAYLNGSEEALDVIITYNGQEKYYQTNAGTTTVNVKFVDSTYGTVEGTVIFEVKPMQVEVVVGNAEGVYGDTPDLSNVSINYGGILEADIDSFAFVVTTNATSESSVDETYPISATYTPNSNYEVEVTDGVYTVNKRNITVKPTNATSVYGAEISLMGYEVVSGSIVNGDTLSIEFTTDATSSSNAGKYLIELVEGTYTNYNVALDESQEYKYEITPKDLSNETLDITLNGSDWNVQSETHRPTLTVKYGELTITSYTPTYSIDSAQTIVNGDYTITIGFTGNYTGSKVVTYYVTTNGMAAVKGDTLDTEMAKLTLNPISELTELPTIEGTNIVWTADIDAVTVVNNKVYLFNPTESNITVTLTADISYGTSSSDVREYTVVVEPTTVEETLTSNGVSVTVPTKEQLELVVTEDQGTYTLSNGESLLSQYNISFTQYGESYTSFSSPVTVKLPVPEGYAEGDVIRIYHVTGEEVDSTYIEPTKIEDGYIYFEATQFSPYIVVKYESTEPNPDESVDRTFVQLSDASMITDGTVIVIANHEAKFYLSAQSDNYRLRVESIDEATVITLVKVQGGYLLQTGENTYLYYTGSNNTVSEGDVTDNTATWTITYDSVEKVFVITNVANTERILQYNASSPRFACYKGTQKNLIIFADPETLGEGTTEPEKPVEPAFSSITYLLDGGTLSDGAPTQYEEGKGVATLPTATKEGYEFKGWTLNGQAVTSISATQTGNVELVAVWEEDPSSDGDVSGTQDTKYEYLEGISANTSYNKKTSTSGWVANNAASVKVGDYMSVILNGKTSAVGSLVSPTLSDGISKLSFYYTNTYSESNGVDIIINIKDSNNNVIVSNRLNDDSVDKGVAEEFVWTLDSPVSGNFIIEILNNSPSNSTSNKDRVSILNISWDTYE